MQYKRIKKLVPWCDKCNSEIRGNGSGILPHNCKCGDWKYDGEKMDYVLKENLSI